MFDQPYIILIFLGLAFQAAGFLVRDELMLRLLVITGILFDIAFFYMQSPSIWGSVLTNSVLVLVNVALIVVIFFERSMLFMSQEDRRVFREFGTLSPGQFRRINRFATWHTAEAETQLLTVNENPGQLFFIYSDGFTVTKRGQPYRAQGPAFAGEIMLLRGGVASASVTVSAGTRYAEWSAADLNKAMQRSQPLKNALLARFGHDLAEKVRNSVPVVS